MDLLTNMCCYTNVSFYFNCVNSIPFSNFYLYLNFVFPTLPLRFTRNVAASFYFFCVDSKQFHSVFSVQLSATFFSLPIIFFFHFLFTDSIISIMQMNQLTVPFFFLFSSLSQVIIIIITKQYYRRQLRPLGNNNNKP